MKKFKLEEFLLPHELGPDGKKLETPEEIDVEKLRKYVYGVLTDKEEAQEARDTAVSERDAAKTELTALQQKNETDEQRRTREQEERDRQFAELQARDRERAKIEAVEEHFKDKGITSARAKRLAKKLTGDDEKAWLAEADELVEDGFRITDKVEQQQEETDEGLAPVVKATRNGKAVAPTPPDKRAKSVGDELDAAGISTPGW